MRPLVTLAARSLTQGCLQAREAPSPLGCRREAALWLALRCPPNVADVTGPDDPGTPTLEGAAGIFRYKDCDGAIARMRECLHAAITAAGGAPAVGSGDRALARPPPGAPDPAPHLPDIVHSTAVRWAAEPADRAAALAAFGRAAATWQPLEITVRGAAAESKGPGSQAAHTATHRSRDPPACRKVHPLGPRGTLTAGMPKRGGGAHSLPPAQSCRCHCL